MKNFLPIITLCSLVLVACGTVHAPAPTVTIKMTPNAFEPTTLNIKQNQQVCFENDDTDGRWPASNIHPTHEIYSEFDPKTPVKPGATWCFTFGRIGIWKFHDHLFPELVGTITVDE